MNDLSEVDQYQESILLKGIRSNSSTIFGRKYRFDRIDTIEAYQKSVPVCSYEDYIAYIERMLEGEVNVLCSEKVLLFEPTGGTASGTKLIPYTSSLKKEFQRGINTWLFDIFSNIPCARHGTSYWSISPVSVDKRKSPGGAHIGFDDDTAYLGWIGGLLNRTLAVPPEIRFIRDVNQFRHLTAFHLLKARDLSVVSVWNPSFFTLILDHIENNIQGLIQDIADGIPGTRKSPKRALEIERAFDRGPEKYKHIWEKLSLLSCWTDGPSRIHAQKLAQMMPGIRIQAKGLLATEGIVTIPIIDADGCVPAYKSHFLEFIPDGENQPRLIRDLEVGQAYCVVMSTGGGLYRYNLKDKLIVTGRWKGLPVMRFEGRSRVSDLVGEKLDEIHVQHIIDRALTETGIKCSFIMLAPEINDMGGEYVLFIESEGGLDSESIRTLGELIEIGLMENFHYKYARDLNQLGKVSVIQVEKGGVSRYMERCERDGQRVGDIKPAALDTRSGWRSWFLNPTSTDMEGDC